MNKKNALLLIGAVFLLVGCRTGYAEPQTLTQAANALQVDNQRAIVLATFQEGEDRSGGTLLKDVLLGNYTPSRITFAGNPYDPNNKHPSRAFFVPKNAPETNIPLAQGTFAISEERTWAYVYPTKFAINTVHSRYRKMAGMGAWARNDRMAYLVFDVRPGEVIYLGNIRANWENDGLIGFRVEDKFEEFSETLPDALRGKVQKRLLQAPKYISTEAVQKVRHRTYTY